MRRQAVQYDSVTKTLIYYYRDEGPARPIAGHGRPVTPVATVTDSANANVRVTDGTRVSRIGGS